jgi:HEAT repeat protein
MMISNRSVLSTLVLAAVAGLASPFAQQSAPAVSPGAMSVEDATTVTQGWAFLAQRDLERAATKVEEAGKKDPRSAAVLTLGVEVSIARGAAAAGLDFYERWLGQRSMEEPVVVRRVAEAMLREYARQSQDGSVRFEARRILAANGDASAAAAMADAAAKGSWAENCALAAMGNTRSVAALIESLPSAGRRSVQIIEALGQSGNRQAVPAVLGKLQDEQPEVRGAAAAALGRLGGTQTIARLKPLLSDRSAHVRVQAASGLYRLDDYSGIPVFQELLANSEAPAAGRLVAAEAMASHPDQGWLALVRGLTSAGEPDIRLSAARLIAPHDPELARSVLESLGADSNLAIREEAGRILAAEVVSDLTALRRLLRSPDSLTQVGAAGRVLALTR